MSKEPSARDSIASQFTSLDRSTWQRSESALLGMIGDKNAKMPLMMTLFDYVERKLERMKVSGDAKIFAARVQCEDEYYSANDTIHNVLSVALRNCAAARTILGKYAAGQGDNPDGEASFYATGAAAWKELRETAMGGEGIETAEGYLQELYRLPDVVNDVETLLIEHDSLVQKIGNIPDMTLEKVWKLHLLRCLKPYPECDIVEHSCATDSSKGYQATVREVKARLNRLKAGSTETGAAFYTNSDVECWKCGQKGHVRADCRVKGSSKNGGKGSKGGSDKGSQHQNKPGKGKTRGALVRKKLREAEAKLATAVEESEKKATNSTESSGFGFSCSEEASTRWCMLSLTLQWLAITLCVCFVSNYETLDAQNWYETVVTAVYACCGYTLVTDLYGRLCSDGHMPVCYAAGSVESDFDFVIDSGASRHTVGDSVGLTGWKPYNARLKIADGSYIEVTGIGDLMVDVDGKRILLKGVWYAPRLKTPLFSVRWHRRQPGCGVSFEDDLYIKMQNGVKIPFSEASNGAFMLTASVRPHPSDGEAMSAEGIAIVRRSPVSVSAHKLSAGVDAATWHNRLGHLSDANVNFLVQNHVCEGIKITGKITDTRLPCAACVTANLKTKPRVKLDGIRSEAPLEVVHVDGVEGFTCESFGKTRGYLFTDDYSRAKFFYGVSKKSDFLSVLQEFTAQMQQRSRKVKIVMIGTMQSDFAAELSAGKTAAWCAEHGIKLQHSAPGSHKEAGVVEKAIDIVKTRARAIHRGAGFPATFWLLSMIAACHVLLFVPNSAFDGQCSYFRLFGAVPNVSHLRTIGCLTFFYNWYSGKQNFITDRGLTGVLVGYCSKSRSYLIWRPDTRRVIRSAEVVFDESIMPMLKPDDSKTDPATMRVVWGQSSDEQLHRIEFGVDDSDQDDTSDGTAGEGDGSPRNNASDPVDSNPVDAPATPVRRSQRVAALDARMKKTWTGAALCAESSTVDQSAALEALCCVALGDELELGTATVAMCEHIEEAVGYYCDQGFEPTTYRDAMACAERHRWIEAMEVEMEALERLGTFRYVSRDGVPRGVKVISSKWIYKIKPEKYKARIVIRGFQQAQRDVGETFSPTIKLVTLRLMFALAAVLGWACCQMDVCSAFLNASNPVGVPVFMECPMGYERKEQIMELLKALYGLKGSPRAWWQHLTEFLKSLGFEVCVLDACAYVLVVNATTELIVGVHVDDLLIVGLTATVAWFVQRSRKSF
jgi:hypothetical protein